MTAKPVTILGSEMHNMNSQHTGRKYRITISLPLGYARQPDEAWPFNATPASWPVVYVLDGNWYAGMVTGIIRPMAWCGRTIDAIVVGISYSEDPDPIEAFRESFTRRDNDLTPVRDEAVEQSMEKAHKRPTPNGDAANFHRFIRDELIPWVENAYRADPTRRILAGHSYGGLFALFSLFTTPGLFRCLIAGSPTLSYGDRFMFQQEGPLLQSTEISLPQSCYPRLNKKNSSMIQRSRTRYDWRPFSKVAATKTSPCSSVFSSVRTIVKLRHQVFIGD